MAERRRGQGGGDGSEDSGLEVEQHHIMELPHGKTHTHFLANVQSVYSATMERRTVMSSGFPPRTFRPLSQANWAKGDM